MFKNQIVQVIGQAIMRYEGWKPGLLTNGKRVGGSRSWRNCNPGNLRLPKGPHDQDKYSVFPTDENGWQMLHADIIAKLMKYPKYTLQQFFDRYAPASDGNNPSKYADFVALQLEKTTGRQVTASTLLRDLG